MEKPNFVIVYLYNKYCYPRKSEGMCIHRRWFVCVCASVCLSVTTITKKIVDGFAPNFMRRFLEERKDQVRVSLRSAEGCESNGQKLRKPAIVYKTGDCLQNSYVWKSETSRLQNIKCGKCCQVLATKTLSRGFVLSQSTFPLVIIAVGLPLLLS